MASSSVSQESLDIEDYETSIRKSKIRNLRARGALGHKGGDREVDGFEREYNREQNGDHGGEQDQQHVGYYGAIPETHDSPSRSTSAGRAKDKRSRPNHLHKGKLPKDKRKLREKRRSTGVVVHLQSTESTGDSLDEDDDGDTKALSEAKRNTTYNEVIDNDNPQTPSEERIPKSYSTIRNKSPSDLEADLEDNQDYDSTVSQSETNLTLIGRADSTETANRAPKYMLGRSSVLSQYQQLESPKSFKSYSPQTSDLELKTPSSTTSTSSSSSVLSRYKYGNEGKWQDIDSAKPFTSYDKTRTVKPVSALMSRYEDRKSDGDVNTNYRGYRNRYGDSVGNSYTNKYTAPSPSKDDDKANLEKLLEKEREEIKKLKQIIEEKDKKLEEKDKQIADLQKEVSELNKELDDLDDENQKLQLENNALIRAVSQLSTNV